MGGRWTSQNKIRPGAYLNFTSVAQPTTTVGDRGIATLAIPLNWGEEGSLIDVYSTDLTDGTSLAKVGFTAFDEEAKLLNLMLSNCYLARVYRLDSGGVRATGTLGNLTAKAKYHGTKGNMITIAVTETDGIFNVITFVDGASKDAQIVATVQELKNNDYVEFSGWDVPTITAGLALTGGTNGTVNPTTAYPAYLALARKARWQTMALTQDNEEFAAQFAKFADEMRDGEGKYVQVALGTYAAGDSISVCKLKNSFAIGDVEYSIDDATAWIAGVTAGASVVQSNVGKVVPGATRIIGELTNSETIEALRDGWMVFTTNQRGEIILEDDINSLHTFTDELSDDMRLNQVIRVMDEWGTNTQDTWEQSFKGKVQNHADGRNAYKSLLISYGNELQNLGAIEEFGGADNITIDTGTDKNVITVTAGIKPVAAMSILYMTVYVS